MKIAILYICTGLYNKFFDEFYKSAEKHLLPDCAKTYFVWTDNAGIADGLSNVEVHQRVCAGFPEDSLFRFEMFLEIETKMSNYDYIYFFNSNALFLSDIGKEILPDECGLVGAKWPRRASQHCLFYPYERNKKSLAYIPPFRGPYAYYMGGINGGTAPKYMEMIRTLARNIRQDYANGIVACFHDESHINRYFWQHKCKVLPFPYCWPEEWESDFAPKIVFRNKVKTDPYFNKGRDRSFKARMKKILNVIGRTIGWFF